MMRTFVKLLSAVALCSAVSACAHKSAITGKNEVVGHEDDLRRLAAFELGCNETRLDVMNMNSNNAAVSGCDKKAVYHFDGAWKQMSKE